MVYGSSSAAFRHALNFCSMADLKEGEEKLEVLATLSAAVQEPLTHGGGQVLSAHTRDSRCRPCTSPCPRGKTLNRCQPQPAGQACLSAYYYRRDSSHRAAIVKLRTG